MRDLMTHLMKMAAAWSCALWAGTCVAATYHVALSGDDAAAGTVQAPWRTLQRAADAARPGDTVLVGAGTYRERVEVRQGGTAEAPITWATVPGARVVISGADLLPDGWSKVEGLDDVFAHDWPHRFPINGPNDLTHPGDKEHELTGRAEQVLHAERFLRQVLRREHLAPGTFFVDLDAQKLLVRLRDGGDPSRTELEASVRTQWFAGAPGVSHVHLRGFTFRYAANHAQRGALFVGAGGGRGWSIEDCVFERANGPGATFSGEALVVRRCVFQDNGQLGFGAWACHDALIEDCGIYRNNAKGYSTDWEAGGTKVTMSRRFVFRRCRAVDNRGSGIWYDVGNEQAEIDRCYVADNDEAGIFYEISYGLHAHDNLIVNNANRGERPGRAWGLGGITLSSSEECVIEHNTLVGNRDGLTFREQNRTTPRIDGSERRILNRQHTVRRNLIAYSRGYNVAWWMDTTFFGPHPGGHDKNDPVFEDPRTLKFSFEANGLCALPGQRNYLYGCVWRPRHQAVDSPAEFTAASGIPDSSLLVESPFVDATARDYRIRKDLGAAAKLGVRPTGE